MNDKTSVIITRANGEPLDKSPDQLAKLIKMGYTRKNKKNAIKMQGIIDIALQVCKSTEHINIIAHTHGEIYRNSRFDSYYYFYQSEITKSSSLKDILIDFNNRVNNKEIYLFSWNEIPGKDNERLLDFLKQDCEMWWVKAAKIEKSPDGNTLKVHDEKNELLLSLNHEKTQVNLEINGVITDDFMVKNENDNINIYKKIIIQNKSDTLCLFEDLENAINNRVNNKEIYLFSWNEIPGKDNERLLDFLKQDCEMWWVKAAKIEKSPDGNTLKVHDEKNELLLSLNHEKTQVNLEINGVITDDFMVKNENDNINIYKKIIIQNKSDTLCLFEDLENAIKGHESVIFNENMIGYAKEFFCINSSLQLEAKSIKNAICFLSNINDATKYTLYNQKSNISPEKNEVIVFVSDKTSSEIEPSGEFRKYIEEKIKTSLLERNNVITEDFLTHLKEDFEKIEDLRKKVEKDAKVNDKINKKIKDFDFKNRLDEYFDEQKKLIINETMNYFNIIKNLKS